jgi:hypothetical protein
MQRLMIRIARLLVGLIFAGPLLTAQTTVVPDYLAYWRVFRQVVIFKNMAAHPRAGEQNRSRVRNPIAKEAGLDDSQAAILEKIATHCVTAVSAQDAKAQALISSIRSQVIGKPQASPPVPIPQLQVLQQERNAIIIGLLLLPT